MCTDLMYKLAMVDKRFVETVRSQLTIFQLLTGNPIYQALAAHGLKILSKYLTFDYYNSRHHLAVHRSPSSVY